MFWSPDSQSVAFDAVGELKRIDVRGGAPRTVCDLPNGAIGGSWNADDVIVVGQPAGGLLRCPAAGGAASEVTRLDATKGESLHLLPSFLPDGRHFLYLSVSRTAPEKSGVYLGSLDEEPGARRPDRLLATGFGAAYVRSEGASTGHVVFLQDRTLFAQAFDERSLQLRGEPVSLAHPVGSFLDGGFFAVSQNDVIAFRAPDKEFQLTWFDRQWQQDGYRRRRGSLFRGRHFTRRLAGCHREGSFPAEHRPGYLGVRFISNDDGARDVLRRSSRDGRCGQRMANG